MKKYFNNIRTLAALLMAGAAFVACSSDDSINENQQPGQNPTGEYSLTIKASKGSKALTRALSPSGSTLNATWKTGEKVKVYQVTSDIGSDSETYTNVGTLTAQVSGEADEADEAILSGTLYGDIVEGNNLALFFNSNNGVLDYTGQTGTLDGIASKYDYATAFVTVAGVAGGTITIENGGDYEDFVPFDNQQAIVKFTLMNGDNNLSASKLTLQDANDNIFQRYNVNGDGSDEKGALTITHSTAGNVFYVAIRTEEDDYTLKPSSLNLTLTAETENGNYTYTKNNVAFENGKYYEITVKMTKK